LLIHYCYLVNSVAKSPALKEHVAASIPRRWWENLISFLFAPERDKWLGALRIGLGLVVTAYALVLRSDWQNLFASAGKGLVSRKLGEAITSFDNPHSQAVGLFLLAVMLTSARTPVFSITWACLLCLGLLLLLASSLLGCDHCVVSSSLRN
jgi:hypothetical protein